MTISIELPEGDGLRVGRGTKVFNSDGVEIEGVCDIEISLPIDGAITAKVTVAIDKIENMNNIHALLGTKTLEDVAKIHGCEIIKKPNDFDVDSSIEKFKKANEKPLFVI